jgi:hypothetical protein
LSREANDFLNVRDPKKLRFDEDLEIYAAIENCAAAAFDLKWQEEKNAREAGNKKKAEAIEKVAAILLETYEKEKQGFLEEENLCDWDWRLAETAAVRLFVAGHTIKDKLRDSVAGYLEQWHYGYDDPEQTAEIIWERYDYNFMEIALTEKKLENFHHLQEYEEYVNRCRVYEAIAGLERVVVGFKSNGQIGEHRLNCGYFREKLVDTDDNYAYDFERNAKDRRLLEVLRISNQPSGRLSFKDIVYVDDGKRRIYQAPGYSQASEEKIVKKCRR